MVCTKKCCHCKYLRRSAGKEEQHLDNLLVNAILKDPDTVDDLADHPEEKVILFGCEANKGNVLTSAQINRPTDCKFFRSNTLTAWQEVKQNVFQTIPNLLRNIANYFIKK